VDQPYSQFSPQNLRGGSAPRQPNEFWGWGSAKSTLKYFASTPSERVTKLRTQVEAQIRKGYQAILASGGLLGGHNVRQTFAVAKRVARLQLVAADN
jgi:hypothetical protein